MQEDFDGWLEEELGKGFAAISRHPVPAAPRYRQSPARRLFPLSLSSRAAASILGAVLLSAGGAAAAAAATGTNPVVLSQQISAAVVTCGGQLASGQSGIGGCVSSFVQERRVTPRPSAEPTQVSGAPAAVSSSASPSAGAHNGTVAGQGEDRGATVSSMAQSGVPGEQHGGDVSKVARDNGGDAVSSAARGGEHADVGAGAAAQGEEHADVTASAAARGQHADATATSKGEEHGDAVSNTVHQNDGRGDTAQSTAVAVSSASATAGVTCAKPGDHGDHSSATEACDRDTNAQGAASGGRSARS